MPFYRFELDTLLSTKEVAERLKAHIKEPRGFFKSIRSSFSLESFLPSKSLDQPLIGTIDDNTFRVRRDIHYRNSFLPLVHGRITPTPTGSHISVKMFMHPLVAVFMLFWLSGVGSIGVLMLFKQQVSLAAFDFIPLGMFIFGVALTYFGFFPEALKAKYLIENAVATKQSDKSKSQNQ